MCKCIIWILSSLERGLRGETRGLSIFIFLDRTKQNSYCGPQISFFMIVNLQSSLNGREWNPLPAEAHPKPCQAHRASLQNNVRRLKWKIMTLCRCHLGMCSLAVCQPGSELQLQLSQRTNMLALSGCVNVLTAVFLHPAVSPTAHRRCQELSWRGSVRRLWEILVHFFLDWNIMGMWHISTSWCNIKLLHV